MEVRKTILYIGNREDDSRLFERAIEMSGKLCNFLALETGYWTLRLLRKSQPFWYEAIVLDLAKPSQQGILLLKEIKSIRQLQHVPVIVYTDAYTMSDVNAIKENGASHYIPRPSRTEMLSGVFTAIGRNNELPFMLTFPLSRPIIQNFRQAS